MSELSTSAKGQASEAAILARLCQIGKRVLIPWGVAPYDLVIDDGCSMTRVQVKTARTVRDGGALVIAARRHSVLSDGSHKVGVYDCAEIDAVAAFHPETGRSYLVPFEEVPVSGMLQLRLTPPKNNQKVAVRMAVDYEI